MNRQSFVRLLFGLCAVAGLSAQAWAIMGVNTPDPNLPPVPGKYMLDTGSLHAMYGSAFLMSNPLHSGFTSITRTPMGPDEVENFNSVLMADLTVVGGPTVPATLTGPVSTVVHGKVGNVTGTFATEMLSMNLSGPTPLGPVMVRESPTLPSLGQTSISDIGGGMYHIDSFFDVFTELSIDGGQQWIPSQNSSRMVLCDVPEPASMVLLSFGLVGVGSLARRRK